MFMREDRLVDDSAMRTHTFFPIRNRISTTSRPSSSGGGGLSASVDDNVGLRVVMPTETERRYYKHGGGNTNSDFNGSSPNSSVAEDDLCRNFVIVGGVLGSLLVAASVMMCILSQRLYKLTKRIRRDKFDSSGGMHKFGMAERQSPALFASRRQDNPLRNFHQRSPGGVATVTSS